MILFKWNNLGSDKFLLNKSKNRIQIRIDLRIVPLSYIKRKSMWIFDRLERFSNILQNNYNRKKILSMLKLIYTFLKM